LALTTLKSLRLQLKTSQADLTGRVVASLTTTLGDTVLERLEKEVREGRKGLRADPQPMRKASCVRC